MAAFLLLRRQVGGALPRLQQPYARLSTAAARQDTLDAGCTGSKEDRGNKNRWRELPPFAPLDITAAARAILRGKGGEAEETSSSTAIRWVRRCCPDLPASLVQKLFRLRKVKKNALTAETSSTDASAEQFQLKRDKAIIVINKPPGMPVQGGVGIKNSIDVLAPMFEENSSEAPRLVHRLDRDCSGVLVLGRTQLSASILHAIFREKTADALADGTQQVLQRKYVALVIGTPRHSKGLLSAPLAKVLLQDGKSERLTVKAGPNTTSVQDALTEYRVIESCPQGFTWLELFPLTGRKHQLRVHCAEVLGTPIVGDYKYGRQAHQNWSPLPAPQAIEEELLKKRRLPFGLVLGGGSVVEEQPQLHLHCKQMVLPDISAAVQGLQSEDADRDFSDLEKLSFVAPLPQHMRLSWEVLKSVNK
ncbi:RNA pseudouridine synthase 4, mitochondrial isoform X2 [Brachypodium distachyon]|uniref:Pseudouridine synthase RsuA/RluA-like domain-containing protein n=1 Tax=Brachypodium distachyon TaxID=15368 RepID=A0A0Q3H0Q5_BRADI|nr:RNA pseudouridine synthase 4, mitochondrial isoform X2 [Brachypodium distachyon]KQJ86874.1 hypothetical protein BRADI_4g08187v3 [Brachypodium distachyon]|eukprot:XP_014758562.1 RNA pseudouridine synthase 4, mitochondrial isoform X2 [Brachypodium distachyon]